MKLCAVIWKNSSDEISGYIIEDYRKAIECFKDVRPFHPEAIIIEFPIKGLIL